MNIYNLPESEIANEESENFGGWLRFFQVLNIVWLTFLPLSLLVTLAIPFIDPEENIFTILKVEEVFVQSYKNLDEAYFSVSE